MSKEELQRLKELYKAEYMSNVKEKIADAMVSYGNEAVPYLIECAGSEMMSQNKESLLEKIAKIKGAAK